MIVGTAGHIDHGKTTLVQALTGVDTDRLPEEKQRGISIALGYAFLDAPGGGRIGFIDVPGHERLVHTMVAGASGIDYALLLVAADDGPMPQTREHLAVLALLGIARGAVVITKADRADAARIDAVRAEMQALLTGTPLAQAPVLAVSAHSGDGIEALRTLLFEADAQQPVARADDDALGFRLAIDRAFTLAGAGTVVTGTVHAGQLHAGEELALVPGSQQARARSLHAQNRPVASAHAGQRCAVALPGLAREDAARGQWLTHPAVALATDRLDARLMLWQGEARPLRSGARVLAHIGAAQVAASVAVLDTEVLAPGASALVQLVLHAPVGAWHGERVLLRDAAASRTLAGGRVLDPFAPTRYRRTPQRLAELAALELSGSAARLAALLAAAPQGVDLRRFARAQGLLQWPRSALPESALVNDGMALGAEQAEGFTAAALAALQAFHERQPDELGPDTARLRRLAAPRLPMPLWQALLARLGERGLLAQRGACVHLPSHGAQLSATETRIAQKVAPALDQAGFEGAWARDLARDAGEPEPLVRTTLARLARRGELHQIVKDLFYPPASMQRLATIAREVGAAHEGDVLAAAFRDATGLGRKRAIQILEYFDRIGLTRRIGDTHRLRDDCALFMS
ncbi:selenocysteine-specific translation elongation factor [Ottowia sp.]|uniref:selenocysteine-specific translation elongation factor n=1 Tax=Ottowia sp. TaxID=1898956 RepID=UPI002D1BFA39|nr:selenocysteine-specific translation elongation factor [Ottowia sp.]HRN74702.1 selenocysteine-specific translation elongation factor [Ottowia sp.]HRQ01532.1 selenocysteine-specific translation elongation factor [Ottowia sp.]